MANHVLDELIDPSGKVGEARVEQQGLGADDREKRAHKSEEQVRVRHGPSSSSIPGPRSVRLHLAIDRDGHVPLAGAVAELDHVVALAGGRGPFGAGVGVLLDGCELAVAVGKHFSA